MQQILISMDLVLILYCYNHYLNVAFQSGFSQPLTGFHNYLQMVQPLEGLALPWYFLRLIVFQCLYILQTFSLVPCISECFEFAHSLCVGLVMEISLYCEQFPGFPGWEVSEFLSFFTSVASVSSSISLTTLSAYLMTDSTYDMAFVLHAGLIFQNLSYALLLLKSCILIMGYHVTMGQQSTPRLVRYMF